MPCWLLSAGAAGSEVEKHRWHLARGRRLFPDQTRMLLLTSYCNVSMWTYCLCALSAAVLAGDSGHISRGMASQCFHVRPRRWSMCLGVLQTNGRCYL